MRIALVVYAASLGIVAMPAATPVAKAGHCTDGLPLPPRVMTQEEIRARTKNLS